MIVLLIMIVGYILTGMISTRLFLRSFWSRAQLKDYNRSELEGPSGYVAMLSTFNFIFWPILTPINFLLDASHNMDPENLQAQLNAKSKNEKRMQREINALEKANNMELSQW